MIIEVTKQGKTYEVIFDDNFEITNNIHISHYGYASSRVKGKLTLWHRVVIGAKKGEVVDHINGNKLDNRKANLRIVSRAQNNSNVKARGYTIQKGRYVVRVAKKYIGCFETPEEAQAAYQKAHAQHYGEFSPHGREKEE